MNRSKVKIDLIGGVGNQLFCYFAGRDLAEKLELEAEYNLGSIGKNAINHKSYITDFNFQGNFVNKVYSNLLFNQVNRVDLKLGREYELYRKLTNLILPRFFSDNIGFDSKFNNIEKATRLVGYFQTYKHFENVCNRSKLSFALNNSSEWYLGLDEVAKTSQPIIMHYRRNDYLTLGDTFGILSVKYYKNALILARKHFPNNPIWLFSDSSDSALELARQLQDVNLQIIDKPHNLQDTQALMAMTLGKCHIIANSTFSWWGAALSKSSSLVIAPDKWFKSMNDPIDLLPPTWTKIPSHWCQY